MPALVSTAVLFTLPSGTRTVDFTTGDLPVANFVIVQIDIDLTAGTLSILTERKGADNIYYPLGVSEALAVAPSKLSILVAPGAPTGANPRIGYSQFPGQRLRVTFDITTTATFSASIMGR